MKKQPRLIFQGDIAFVEVESVPKDARKLPTPKDGRHILGHSETGHHHFINAADACHFEVADPLVCYLALDRDSPVIHDRPWDTHAPQVLKAGKIYMGVRQVERAPEGWRRVSD